MAETVKVGKTVETLEYGVASLGKNASGTFAIVPTGYIDDTNNVAKVEERFAYSGIKVADALIKSGPGFLHAIQIACNDSAPTAGNLDVYDNTTNSGTKIFSMAFTTTFFLPVTVIFDVSFATGLYFDFTTTADVNVSASYR